MHVVAVVTGDGQLVEVVLATSAGGGFTHFLHRRQQQAYQDGDDGDYHQQLDQRETATCGSRGNGSWTHGDTPHKKEVDGKRLSGNVHLRNDCSESTHRAMRVRGAGWAENMKRFAARRTRLSSKKRKKSLCSEEEEEQVTLGFVFVS
jgi:hypothetical protein